MKRIFACLALLAICIGAYAQTGKRVVTISKFHPISENRPAAPASQNLIRVYVNSGDWGNTDCRRDAADLLESDTHLLSILLAAWIAGKTIAIEVDERSRPWSGDTVCQITALDIS